MILEFEITAVCQFDRNTALQTLRNGFKLDDWKGILDKVKLAANACVEMTAIIDARDQRKSMALEKILKEQVDKIEQQFEMSHGVDEQFRNLQLEELRDIRVEQRSWRLTDKEERCLQTLRTSEYEKHKARNPDRVDGTCRWFLDHQNYKAWYESKKSALLWVSADPGCGKSVLSKSIIDNEVKSGNSRTTCFFFFKDDNPDQISAAKALSALLHQLFVQNRFLIKYSTAEFEANGIKLPELFSRMWAILLHAAADPEAGEIVCVLDALDECEESGRHSLIDALNEFYCGRSDIEQGFLKFIVTSRPYFDIERRFNKVIESLPTIRLAGEEESDSISQEINLVIKDIVQRIGHDLKLENSIKASLTERLLGVTHRTYLWLILITDVIYKQLAVTEKSLLRVIDRLPETIDEAYNAILNRSTDLEQAKKLLHIVVSATRPLTLQEMNIALAIEPVNRSHTDLDLEPEEFFKVKIRNLCGLFVSLIDSKIYLIHQTAREFLVRNQDSKGIGNDLILLEGQWKHSLDAVESNKILTDICIAYLSFVEFEKDPLKSLDIPNYHQDFYSRSRNMLSQYTEKYKFLNYASSSWFIHFQGGLFDEESEEFQLTLRLCDNRSKVFRTWFSVHQDRVLSMRLTTQWTDLVIGSYLGHALMIQRVLRTGTETNINYQDEHGRTPLMWALSNDHVSVVELLLKTRRDIDLNIQDESRSTALMIAVLHSNWKMLRVLLTYGADVNFQNKDGETALMKAANNELAVRLLLERQDIGLNLQNAFGHTALMKAVMNANETATKFMLEHQDIDVNLRNNNGNTALMIALRHKNETAIEQLLKRQDIDLKLQDKHKYTALMIAIREKNEIATELLLQQDIGLNLLDTGGNSALMTAVRLENQSVVKSLLERQDVNVNLQDINGNSALMIAVRLVRKHLDNEEIAELLLKCQDVNVNLQNRFGETALMIAVTVKNESIAKLLLANQDIDLNLQDKYGNSALMVAMTVKNETAVKLLLRCQGVNVNLQNICGRTALMKAAGDGKQTTVELLLQRRDIDLNLQDQDGHTALTRAVCNNFVEITTWLLEYGADSNLRDRNGHTPLSIAENEGFSAIAYLLKLHSSQRFRLPSIHPTWNFDRTEIAPPLEKSCLQTEKWMWELSENQNGAALF